MIDKNLIKMLQMYGKSMVEERTQKIKESKEYQEFLDSLKEFKNFKIEIPDSIEDILKQLKEKFPNTHTKQEDISVIEYFKEWLDFINKQEKPTETENTDIDIDDFDAEKAKEMYRDQQLVNKILSDIKEQVNNGKNYFRIYETLSDYALNILKEKQFNIYTVTDPKPDYPHYIIYLK